MLPDDLYSEMNSLQLQIDENERNFDIALQISPIQVELAKELYKNIKVLEGRLEDLRNLLNEESGPG